MKINLHVTRDRMEHLTVEQCITLEDPSEATIRQLRDAVAPFVIDENGAYMDAKSAQRMLGQLTAMNDFADVARQLMQQIRAVAVSSPKGGNS